MRTTDDGFCIFVDECDAICGDVNNDGEININDA